MRNFNRGLTLKIHKAAYNLSSFNFIFFSSIPFLMIYALTFSHVAIAEYTSLFQAVFSSMIISFLIAGVLNPVFSGYVGRARYYGSYNGVFIWLCVFLAANFVLTLLLKPLILFVPFFAARKPFLFLSALISGLMLLTGYFQAREKYLLILKSSLYSLPFLFLPLSFLNPTPENLIYSYEMFLVIMTAFLIYYAYSMDKRIHKYLTDFSKLLKDYIRWDKITISLLLSLIWLPEKLVIFNNAGTIVFRDLMIKYTTAFLFVFPAYYYLIMRMQSYWTPFRAKTPFFKELCLAPYDDFMKKYKATLEYLRKTFYVSFLLFCIFLVPVVLLTMLTDFLSRDVLIFAVGTFAVSVFLFMVSLFHSFQFDLFALSMLSGYYISNIIMAVLFIRQGRVIEIVAGNAVISIIGVLIAMFYFRKLNLSRVNNYLRGFSSVYPDLGMLQEHHCTVDERLDVEEVRMYARRYIKRQKRR